MGQLAQLGAMSAQTSGSVAAAAMRFWGLLAVQFSGYLHQTHLSNVCCRLLTFTVRGLRVAGVLKGLLRVASTAS